MKVYIPFSWATSSASPSIKSVARIITSWLSVASGSGVCGFFMTSEGGGTVGSRQREPKADGKMRPLFFTSGLGLLQSVKKHVTLHPNWEYQPGVCRAD